MRQHRRRFAVAVGVALAAGGVPGGAADGPPADAARGARLNELAPENKAIAERAGTWEVTETSWAGPGAAPVTTTGLVAERRMVGALLQEVLRPAADPTGRDIKRIDYLTFNQVSGRWEYVSMDTRADVALMPAWSFTRADADGKVVLLHDPFVVPGGGPRVTAVMQRMDTVITRQGPDRDAKDQHFVATDGTGTVWLAHRYAYLRRP